MIPLHFGRSDQPLFGIYSQASEPLARRGVVICNPWGMEALRAHRSLRQLAHLLSQAGLDTLRFDYSGTGDSFGEPADLRLDQWIDDTDAALDELSAAAGIRRATVIGLRLGSHVAAKAAARRSDLVDRVVLWEPVFDGAEHLADLAGTAGAARASDLGVAGFPLPQAFRDDLASATLRDTSLPGARVRVVHSGDRPPALDGFAARELAVSHIPAPQCWLEEGDFGAGAVPVDLLKAIVEWAK